MPKKISQPTTSKRVPAKPEALLREAPALMGVREFRDQASHVLRSTQPILVTRRGKPAGLYIPLSEGSELTRELRNTLLETIGNLIQEKLAEQGVTEEEILADFESSRRPRR